MDAYGASIIGLLLICLMPVVLAGIVGPFKGKAGLIGGPVADQKDENFLYRLDRTHENSVESIPVFVAPSILAMMVGLGPGYLAFLVWAFFIVRIAYSVVYLRGGEMAKGGSLRTILYVLGSLATLVVIVSTLVAAL